MTLVDVETGEVVYAPPVIQAGPPLMVRPAEYAVEALTEAKELLARATTADLPVVVEGKARAEAMRAYIAQRNLGEEAQLTALEIVRRAERRIGQLIREGQANGEIRTRKTGRPSKSCYEHDLLRSPTDFASASELVANGAGIYHLADNGTDEDFEAALAEARAEGNLSRANVVSKLKARTHPAAEADQPDGDKKPRKAKNARAQEIAKLAEAGYSSRQISERIGIGAERVRLIAQDAGIVIQADGIIGKTRRIDPNRVANETVHTVDGLAMGLELIDFDQLDPAEVEGWVTSLSRSLPVLTRFHKRLKEMSRG